MVGGSMDITVIFWILADIAGLIGFLASLWYGQLFLQNPTKLLGLDQPYPRVNPWKPGCGCMLSASELVNRKKSIVIRRIFLTFAYLFFLFILGNGLERLLSWMPWFDSEGTRISYLISYSVSFVIVLAALCALERAAHEQASMATTYMAQNELIAALNDMAWQAQHMADDGSHEHLDAARTKTIAVLQRYSIDGDNLKLFERINEITRNYTTIKHLGIGKVER